MTITVREYFDETGASPFADWFEWLNASAAAKVATALYRLEQGNFSTVNGVGGGVYECKINFGPGYRVYFGKEGGRNRYPAWWRLKKAAERGHLGGFGVLARV